MFKMQAEWDLDTNFCYLNKSILDILVNCSVFWVLSQSIIWTYLEILSDG